LARVSRTLLTRNGPLTNSTLSSAPPNPTILLWDHILRGAGSPAEASRLGRSRGDDLGDFLALFSQTTSANNSADVVAVRMNAP